MSRHAEFLVIALAAGCICAPAQDANAALGTRELAEGGAALRAGRLAEARIDFERSARDAPENSEAEVQLGLLFGRSGDIAAAEGAFRKALRANPDSAEAHFNLGLTMVADFTGKRDLPQAIAEFRAAIRLRPKFAEAHRLLGAALAQAGERDTAITELRTALAYDPHSTEALVELGRLYESVDNATLAEIEFRTALSVHPGLAQAEVALGKLLLKRDNQEDEAIEHFRQALRTDPDLTSAQYSLGRALQQKGGHKAEADIAFREAAASSKRGEDAAQCTRLSNEGLDAAHNGQFAIAVKKLKEAVALCPDSPVAHYNLGLLLADRGDLAAARAQVVEAISLLPSDPKFYGSLARMWQREGDRRHAMQAMERAAALEPENQVFANELRLAGQPAGAPPVADSFEYGAATDTPDAHFAFATVLAQREDWLGSSGEWLTVVRERPADVDARNNLGISYAHCGQDDNAELEFHKALWIAPDSADAHFGLAVLHLQHGDKAHAAEELRRVVRARPDYPGARSLLLMAEK